MENTLKLTKIITNIGKCKTCGKTEQHLDYNSTSAKFECNSSKKTLCLIRTALFYLRRYGTIYAIIYTWKKSPLVQCTFRSRLVVDYIKKINDVNFLKGQHLVFPQKVFFNKHFFFIKKNYIIISIQIYVTTFNLDKTKSHFISFSS